MRSAYDLLGDGVGDAGTQRDLDDGIGGGCGRGRTPGRFPGHCFGYRVAQDFLGNPFDGFGLERTGNEVQVTAADPGDALEAQGAGVGQEAGGARIRGIERGHEKAENG
jgi:hypothetical protein